MDITSNTSNTRSATILRTPDEARYVIGAVEYRTANACLVCRAGAGALCRTLRFSYETKPHAGRVLTPVVTPEPAQETPVTSNRIVADYIAPNGTRVVAVKFNGKHYVANTSKALRTTIFEGSTRITKKDNAALWYGIYDLAFPAVEVAPEATVTRLSNGDYRVTHSGGFSNYGKRGAAARADADTINENARIRARVERPVAKPGPSKEAVAEAVQKLQAELTAAAPEIGRILTEDFEADARVARYRRESAARDDRATPSLGIRAALKARTPDETVTCAWYALCANPSVGTVSHPILGDVPICDRCCDKHSMRDRFTPYA